MASGNKIGSNAWSNFIERGRVEAAQFNEGLRAMNAPPIVEAPAIDAPTVEPSASFNQDLDRAAAAAESRSIEPEGRTR